MKFHALLVACVSALSGCASTGPDGIGSGSALGLAGGPGGGKSAAAIVEAMAGGLIAGPVGAELTERDRRRALEAEYRALEHTPNGEPVVWRSSDPARYGEVVAAQPYRVGSQDCRQYSHTVHAGGQPQVARGTACRNSDGSWTPLT